MVHGPPVYRPGAIKQDLASVAQYSITIFGKEHREHGAYYG